MLFSIYSIMCFPSLLQEWPIHGRVFLPWLYFWHAQTSRRIVMFSYGSGFTSIMFSFKINEAHHPFSLQNFANAMDVSKKFMPQHVVTITDILWAKKKKLQLSRKFSVHTMRACSMQVLLNKFVQALKLMEHCYGVKVLILFYKPLLFYGL